MRAASSALLLAMAGHRHVVGRRQAPARFLLTLRLVTSRLDIAMRER